MATMRKIIISAIAAMAATTSWAQLGLDDVQFSGHVGYAIGGTAPIGITASIRSLNSYKLKPNISAGFNAYKPIEGRWGAIIGVQLENKGMETDATVKNYRMEITRGGETLSGVFTGKVVTKVREWMFTIPVLAACDLGDRVRLKAGPYVSFVSSNEFNGYAYDGYLRVGDPTGTKVELGSEESQRGTYDFSNDMRKMQYGIMVGADVRLTKRFGVYADLEWGLSSIHKSYFKTIEQRLYPIYGVVGITYSINSHDSKKDQSQQNKQL